MSADTRCTLCGDGPGHFIHGDHPWDVERATAVGRLTHTFVAPASSPAETPTREPECGGCGMCFDCDFRFTPAVAPPAGAGGEPPTCAYCANEHRNRVEAEVENQGLHATIAGLRDEVERYRRMLGTATVRLGICRDRMEGCADHGREVYGDLHRHEVSLEEIPAWIEEQCTALTPPTTTAGAPK